MSRSGEDLLYVSQAGGFSVVRERHGERRHWLDVLCGGVGMYERRLTMTAAEVAEFAADPEALTGLAARVRKWPEVFGERVVTL